MALTANIKVSANILQTGPGDYGEQIKRQIDFATRFTNGTGANQSDILFLDERTVGDGSDDDIDLAGVLTDAFGTTVAMAEMTGIVVANRRISGTANTTDLTIGAGSNPFLGFVGGTTPTIGPIKPGGVFALFAGDAAGIGTVTATTADILRITNGAGAANTYQIMLLGRSA